MKTRSTDYDDFDDVVVDRLVNGDRLTSPISAPDAAETVRRLAELGYHDGQIALKLGMHRRSIVRIRQRLGVQPALPPGDHVPKRSAPTRPRALR